MTVYVSNNELCLHKVSFIVCSHVVKDIPAAILGWKPNNIGVGVLTCIGIVVLAHGKFRAGSTLGKAYLFIGPDFSIWQTHSTDHYHYH